MPEQSGPFRRLFQSLLACALWGIAQPVAAFCGFYAASADSKLYANASMVVLMRQGTRTVLSMQNNYQGPAEAFALVIPVPSVLKKEHVKTLPKSVFERVDALGAPRLVEYWEVDPCRPFSHGQLDSLLQNMVGSGVSEPLSSTSAIKIEAQFAVAEYDIVVLSANDSAALERWLAQNHYNIPRGAAPILAPYVAAGTKFFVAKVDPKRVSFVDGQAALSPLRFYYDTPEFSLPVRLGLLNSQGQQDLIVSILAEDRYELANYPNVTIPTNIRVRDEVRADFGGFYEALLKDVWSKNRGAVITEYAWDATSCDPCPTPPLTPTDLATLGADVTGMAGRTLTRLHYRYTAATLGEDLVFKRAGALIGGRGMPNAAGELEREVRPGDANNFQGRYAILHAWDGELKCATPQRGRWNARGLDTQSAKNVALIGAKPREVKLSSMLAQPDLTLTAKPAPAAPAPALPAPEDKPPAKPAPPAAKPAASNNCSCLVAGAEGDAHPIWLVAAWAALLCARRARRRR